MVSVQKNAAAEVGAGFLLDLLKRLDIEVGRLVHVQAAEEPEDRDVELPQERSRIEAARPVASHLRVDLSEWFRERRAARAREGGDVGGLTDADGRPRLDDRKCDRRLARRGERDHPPTLAAADESDSFWVEVRLPREEARRGRRVVRIGADCLVGRELPRVGTGRGTIAAFVVVENRDPFANENPDEELSFVPQGGTGSVHPDDGRMRSGRAGDRERSREDGARAGESHFLLPYG